MAIDLAVLERWAEEEALEPKLDPEERELTLAEECFIDAIMAESNDSQAPLTYPKILEDL
ncbi:MAG: hypothetical protein KBF93_06955 [Leptospiraceae bacterium]|nr:hypothetical protein [Leptospiraceae bacterium]